MITLKAMRLFILMFMGLFMSIGGCNAPFELLDSQQKLDNSDELSNKSVTPASKGGGSDLPIEKTKKDTGAVEKTSSDAVTPADPSVPSKPIESTELNGVVGVGGSVSQGVELDEDNDDNNNADILGKVNQQNKNNESGGLVNDIS